MNSQQIQQQFHPMNEPYISQRYSSQRRVSSNMNTPNAHQQEYSGNTNVIVSGSSMGLLPAYESERLLQYSQASSVSDKYNQQVYSRSSTNILGGESRQREIRKNQGMSRQQNEHQSQSRQSHQGHNQPFQNTNHSQQNHRSQYYQQREDDQERLSTNFLHEKIRFLQKELQQLTRILQEESKVSYGSMQEYEEVAIENAQLTIKVRELEEELGKMQEGRQRAEKELMELGVEYEREHGLTNELREKLVETSGKLRQLQREQSQLKSSLQLKPSLQSKNTPSQQAIALQQKKNSYSATLQRQNVRLTEQIQTLLSKLHNLNVQINEQQSGKEQLMGKMNEQLEEIEKLRKEVSDMEVERLEMREMNEYLKQEIGIVTEMAAKRQKQLQEKYIKQDLDKQFAGSNAQLYNETHTPNNSTHKFNNENHSFNNETHTFNNETHTLNNSTQIIKDQTQKVHDQTQIVKENHSLKFKVTQLQSHVHTVELENTHLQSHIHQLQTHIHERQSHIHERQTHIHSLQTHINQIKSQMNQHEQHLQHSFQHNEQHQHQSHSLKQQIHQLQTQIIQLTHSNQSLNYQLTQLRKRAITPPRESKSEPFKELFGIQESLRHQLKLLEQELSEEKDRHQLINNKYTQMVQNRQQRIDQLQVEVKKITAENRTLKIQIQDKRKQRDQAIEQRNQAVEECQRLQQKVQQIRSSKKVQQIRSSKSLISLNNSSWHERQTNDKLERVKYEERAKYQQTIRDNNQINKKLLEQKTLQIAIYHSNITSLQQQLTQHRTQLYQLTAKLSIKDNELKQKEYLLQQLHQLQDTHQQLIDQVKLIKNSKNSLQEEWKIAEESVKKHSQQQVLNLKKLISQKDHQITQLQHELTNLHQQLTSQTNTQLKPSNTQSSSQPHSSCPLCPQVLKQFSIYKQLMELKFSTMNQMLDELKISFIRAQFEIKDQIHKDKSKYDYWIQKYDSHDKEYRVLMERLWEWEKINAKNTTLTEGLATFANKQQYMAASGLRYHNHPEPIHSHSSPKNTKDPAPHLSQIEYDLYLIKLENSTLRSQISTLQKELSQRDQNPHTSKQLQQLRKFSQNLTHQNDQLKNHLSLFMSHTKIPSSKEMTFGPSSESNIVSSKGLPKRESIFERYSNIAHINTELQEKTRNEQKALASAELLISKLKRENDNLIEAKHFLQEQLDREAHKYRELVKQLQTSRERTRRQHEYKSHSGGNTQLQLIDRHNIPFEYIKHHPEHKRLQTEFVGLKRSYLEMDLELKKAKDFYEEELQKMKIQNDFHKERIGQLEEEHRQSIKANLVIGNGLTVNMPEHNVNMPDHTVQNGTAFSFNTNHLIPSTNPTHFTSNQQRFTSEMSKLKQNAVSMSLSQDNLALNQTKTKALEQRVHYLEKQVQLKYQECDSYAKKYEELMKELLENPRTPRNNSSNQDHINRIQKLASNIDVSPIQSPQWQTHSHDRRSLQGQHSDRLFAQNQNNTVAIEQKLIDKLKQCIDKKMIELEITPRQSSNIVIKATWFIERLANDIKELRNNIQILKGQRKAIMKERNQLKQIIENQESHSQEKAVERGFRKPQQIPQRYNENYNSYEINQIAKSQTGYEHSKARSPKPHQYQQKIPKLNFESRDSPQQEDQPNENQFPDVIKQTLELKNQRRSGLKKFQKQLQILSEN